jgi:hypothetical protein
VVFENATTESVAIYLVEKTGTWLVGHAEPGRTSVLRLPVALRLRRGREFAILVVRAGGRRDQPNLRASRSNVTRSELTAGEHIAAIRWRLVDRQLIATPLFGSAPFTGR